MFSIDNLSIYIDSFQFLAKRIGRTIDSILTKVSFYSTLIILSIFVNKMIFSLIGYYRPRILYILHSSQKRRSRIFWETTTSKNELFSDSTLTKILVILIKYTIPAHIWLDIEGNHLLSFGKSWHLSGFPPPINIFSLQPFPQMKFVSPCEQSE